MEDKDVRSALRDRGDSVPGSASSGVVSRNFSHIKMLFVPALILAGAVIISYLSLLSSNTISLVGELSQLQDNAERLRHRVVDYSPDLYGAREPSSSELAKGVRGSLLALKDRDIRDPFKQPIKAVILLGGEFIEQAEQVWFTHVQFEEVLHRLSGLLNQVPMNSGRQAIYNQLSASLLSILHPADFRSGRTNLEQLNKQLSDLELQIAALNEVEKQPVLEMMALLQPALSRYVAYQPVIESVTENRFINQLRLVQSDLLRYDQMLNRQLHWFAVLWGVLGLGLAGIRYWVYRSEPEQEKTMVGVAPYQHQRAEVDEAKEAGETQDTKPGLAGLLDIPYMVDNMDGDQQAVTMLLEVFLEEHSADAKRLAACLQAGKDHEAGLIAHSLKSVAGSLGAGPLQRVAAQIERHCKQGLRIEPDEIGQLSEAIGALRLAIVEYLQSGSSTSEAGPHSETELPSDIKPAAGAESPQPAVCKIGKYQESLVVLNTAYMLSTMDGDTESVNILLQVFIDEHAKDAKTLREMVCGCTPDTISEAAVRLLHSLKGVAGSIGAELLRRQVESIEFCYKNKQVVADTQYRELTCVLDETIDAARRYLSEQPTVIG